MRGGGGLGVDTCGCPAESLVGSEGGSGLEPGVPGLMPALPPPCSVTLGLLLNLFMPQFPHFSLKGDNISIINPQAQVVIKWV